MHERAPLLQIANLVVKYGHIQALHGVSLDVQPGEAVAILGANGAGKSTIVRAVSGWVKPAAGRILYAGEEITTLPSWDRAARGMALVPEGGHVFRDMTVEENLRLGAYLESDPRTVRERMEYVYTLFPVLKERRRQIARTMSGGEQQMLAIGRAVMRNPQLLVVDEVSMGLAPVLVDTVFEALRQLKEEGVSMLIVEQNAHETLNVVDRGYVLENGRIVLEGMADDLREDPRVQAAYLGG
ncbi:MAG: ABC transporter ATP-binding protein [Chloroflexi bacterium]|nr:ABC transporter ATP-binding protein [Chloroflexota bacterium]